MSYIPTSDLPFVPSQFESFQTSFDPRHQSIALPNEGVSHPCSRLEDVSFLLLAVQISESLQSVFSNSPQPTMESLASSSHEAMIHHQATYDTPSSHSYYLQQVQSLQQVHHDHVQHFPQNASFAEMNPLFASGPTTNLMVNHHTFTNGMANLTNAHPVNFSQDFNCLPSPGPIIAPVPVSSGIPIHTPSPAPRIDLEHQLSSWPYDTLGTRTVSPVEHHTYDFASSTGRIPSECK